MRIYTLLAIAVLASGLVKGIHLALRRQRYTEGLFWVLCAWVTVELLEHIAFWFDLFQL